MVLTAKRSLGLGALGLALGTQLLAGCACSKKNKVNAPVATSGAPDGVTPAAASEPALVAGSPSSTHAASSHVGTANGATASAAGYAGHGEGSVDAATIAQFAPPALPVELSRRIQTLLDLRGVGGGHVVGAGKQMFFNWNITGSSQVWRQDGPNAFAVQLTGGEDRTAVAAVAPDESFVVVSRDIGGAENPGLYLLAPKGGALTLVQHTPKVQAALQFIADDSKAIYYTANDVKPDTYTVYRWDVATKQRAVAFDQPGLWSIADHKGQGTSERWLMQKALGNNQIEVYEYAPSTKTLTPLLGQNEKVLYEVAYGAGDDVLVTTDKLSDVSRGYVLRKGALTPITPELKFDVEDVSIDQARKRIYYLVNEAGYYRTYALDAKNYKPVALPGLPAAENTRVAGLDRSGRFVQFAQDGSQQVQTVVVYDWQTRKATTWRNPATPEVDVSKFAKVSLEAYPARDGTQIPMFVRRPDKCVNAVCPVVVSFHGGPEGQSTAGFSAIAQLYVDAGFVYVQPNVRGSTGYGKAWLHADDGAKRLQVITDIEDAARYIRKAWAKDGVAPKIGVTGGSYGGYSTLMAMTFFAGAYDVGVSVVGISNLVTFIQNTAPYRRILRSSEYGNPDGGDKDVMVQLSPTTHVDKLQAPLLVIQGVNDPRVPVGESLQMHKAMLGRGVQGGLILFADEGHGASKRSNVVLMAGHTFAFLQKHLQ